MSHNILLCYINIMTDITNLSKQERQHNIYVRFAVLYVWSCTNYIKTVTDFYSFPFQVTMQMFCAFRKLTVIYLILIWTPFSRCLAWRVGSKPRLIPQRGRPYSGGKTSLGTNFWGCHPFKQQQKTKQFENKIHYVGMICRDVHMIGT